MGFKKGILSVLLYAPLAVNANNVELKNTSIGELHISGSDDNLLVNMDFTVMEVEDGEIIRFPGSAECNATGGKVEIQFDSTNSNHGEELFYLAMMAKAGEGEVDVTYSENSGACYLKSLNYKYRVH